VFPLYAEFDGRLLMGISDEHFVPLHVRLLVSSVSSSMALIYSLKDLYRHGNRSERNWIGKKD